MFTAFLAAALLVGNRPVRAAEPDHAAHIEVVVRDRRGRIVRNLGSADFALEDGAAKLFLKSAAFVEGEADAPRLVSLVFQRMAGESAEISRAAALALVAEAHGRVDFAIFEIDRSLSLLQGFTRNPQAVRAAIERATGKRRKASDAAFAADTPSRELGETTRRILRAAARVNQGGKVPPSLSALLAIANGQGREPGRKAAVYFCENLPIASTEDEAFRTIVSAANLARVAIYALDASGLAASNEEERARALMSQSMSAPIAVAGHTAQLPVEAYATTSATAGAPRQTSAPRVLAELAGRTGGFMVSRGSRLRASMRRILEDCSAYYELTYIPATSVPDGRYHELQVSALPRGLQVQGRRGYYSIPELPGASVLPYELPLVEILRRDPVQDFTHRVSLYRFRRDGAGEVLDATVEVSRQDLHFQEDSSSGLLAARVTFLGIVRDREGAIVDRVSAEAPMQYPPLLLEQMRNRPLLFHARVELPPGEYSLETALQDTMAGKFSTRKTPFTVAATAGEFGLSSLAVVRSVTASQEAGEDDGMFVLAGKSVTPAPDGSVTGGKAATARIYCRLYPVQSLEAPITLDLQVLKEGKPVLHSPLQVDPRDPKALAPVIALDISKLEAGDYEVQLIARQSDRVADERAKLKILPATTSSADSGTRTAGSGDSGAEMQLLADLAAAPPAPEQERLLRQTRDTALKYSEKLPNFVCTQVTRRMVDSSGKGDWRAIDESAYLITFFEGREHYQELTRRSRAAADGTVAPSLSSSGEYGSLLKEVFTSDAQAFRWIRMDNIRGRAVHVLAYEVPAEHSKYAVSYHGGANRPPVFPSYHGLLFVDPDTGAVMRLTHETGPLPEDIPLRQIGLVVDYDYTAIGAQLYLVPVSAEVQVRHRKNTITRNEVSFRGYQRFAVESRIVGFEGAGAP